MNISEKVQNDFEIKFKNQKKNYHEMMMRICEEEKKLGNRPKLLIHSCCAVCATVALVRLSEYMDITVYFYNPNIHPKSEYLRRAYAQQEHIDLFNKDHNTNIKYTIADYNTDVFFEKTKGFENDKESSNSQRCQICYSLRLENSAIIAKENNFDYWCSALTLSPKKDSQVINPIGIEISKIIGVDFLVSDFKKDGGTQLSKSECDKYNIYRQCYCGCVFAAKDQQIDFKQIVKNAKEYNKKFAKK